MRTSPNKLSYLRYIGLWLMVGLTVCWLTLSLADQPQVPSPAFATMRDALHEALALRFEPAIDQAAQLEANQQPTLASQVTRGIIAYLQVRWHMPASRTTRESAHKALQSAIEEGQKQLKTLHDTAEIRLFIGLAAMFDALLQQEDDTWGSLQLFAQGQAMLQEALTAHETMSDAHLGLGLLYFAGAELPSVLRRIWGNLQGQSRDEAIKHLERATRTGHFSRDLARTFLARIYELERRYEEAIAAGQALRATYPTNGYYALLTGRSQCAHRQYAACATMLSELAAQLKTREEVLARRSDHFDLYYHWGLALYHTEQHAAAFPALRQAINLDARAERDETLWAKYHLARLYEQRGQVATARQIYHTLLRGRNVDDLHSQARQRLANLP